MRAPYVCSSVRIKYAGATLEDMWQYCADEYRKACTPKVLNVIDVVSVEGDIE